jgi:hypothetical protein
MEKNIRFSSFPARAALMMMAMVLPVRAGVTEA